MADRIVQMKDKNGNKCFPIAANPGAPKTSDIQLGLMRTGTNLEADADGVVRVNGSDSFTTSDKEVYSASKMNVDHRFSYNLKADQNIDTNVPGNVDLNTTQYLKIGTYYCSSSAIGQTITNNPANGSFTMRVYNPIGTDYDDESTSSWCYRVRELKDLDGNEWRQSVYTNGTAGVFSYHAWQKVVRQNDLLNMVYPVGSIYMSVSNVSPQSFLGGTWQAFATGRTLVGVDTSQTEFDTVEETGGEKTVTLTVDQIPPHNHRFDHESMAQKYSSGVSVWSSANTSTASALYTTNTGGGSAHNNLQPYITVYMWKRVQ